MLCPAAVSRGWVLFMETLFTLTCIKLGPETADLAMKCNFLYKTSENASSWSWKEEKLAEQCFVTENM